ncbi:hypothetical protein HYPSUDRAFT_45494 [Hypholoma sublateritium FD-334 SS-4]|uniref:Uncharacterized protein n=1 Tax=Hypholoma sublateritium (strain FD-334 SS-4) TaxID=945553 RepID=A0A0D2M4V0_HYPSF|nr:hypothetical protein HYPSUDRAFT_45494 [Hypholoma sublateritium FD-334 SS-4]
MARKTVTAFSIALILTAAFLFSSRRKTWTSSPLSLNIIKINSDSDFPWDKVLAHKTLVWQKCYDDFQCARLLVPLNYSAPDAEQASIALIRKRAIVRRGPLYRGPILINPGGPGGSGVDVVLLGGKTLSTILGPQFDIVGFDPRGVGRSLPRASFFRTDAARALWAESVRYLNISGEGIGRAWALFHVYGGLAAENDDGGLKHINTDQTARDMLRIVEAHGRSKLQYWGFSYGSVLGASFAAMFPDKVERIVIDGVVDAEDYYKTLWAHNLLDTDKAMNMFFSDCADAGPYLCAFWAPTAADIERNLTTIFTSLSARPISVHTNTSYGIVDYTLLHHLIFGALYFPYATFPKLAQALAALTTGDARPIYEMAIPAPKFECSCDENSGRAYASVPDATMAILCNDGDVVPGDLDATQAYYDMMTKSSKWGDIWSNIRMGCVGWPSFPKNHFQGPFDANTSHPILIIGNTADPVTPLWAAKKMSTKFPGSVVLTQNTGGHCSISAPSICTMKYVASYFLTGNLPNPDTICQPVVPVFNGVTMKENQEETISLEANMMQEPLMASLSAEDVRIFEAVMELVNTPGIVPRLGV